MNSGESGVLQRRFVSKTWDGLPGVPEGRKLDYAPYRSISCPKYSQRQPEIHRELRSNLEIVLEVGSVAIAFLVGVVNVRCCAGLG
jgi:hypothetical protein